MSIEDEFLRFIGMKSILKDFDEPFQLSPSGPIDLIWHDKIVDTESYLDLCNRYGGFFHHTEKSKEHKKFERYKFTLDFYRETFKEEPIEKFWPCPKKELRECLYCLKSAGPFELENKECDHFFCKQCIVNFIKHKKRCPLCDKNFLKPFVIDCKLILKDKDKDEFSLSFYQAPTYEEFCAEFRKLNNEYSKYNFDIVYAGYKLSPTNFMLSNNATLFLVVNN